MNPIDAFVARVAAIDHADDVCNPWADTNVDDIIGRATHENLLINPAQGRRQRLRAHLSYQDPLVLAIGEAPGWRGARISGVAFTSERLLCDGWIPRIAATPRLSTRTLPLSEPSATVVWGTLNEAGIADRTILWNAFALHPHLPGQPLTNRAPTRVERRAGLEILQAFIGLYPEALVLAIGQHAATAIAEILETTGFFTVRHPSFGGATIFRQSVCEMLVSCNLARFQPRLAI